MSTKQTAEQAAKEFATTIVKGATPWEQINPVKRESFIAGANWYAQQYNYKSGLRWVKAVDEEVVYNKSIESFKEYHKLGIKSNPNFLLDNPDKVKEFVKGFELGCKSTAVKKNMLIDEEVIRTAMYKTWRFIDDKIANSETVLSSQVEFFVNEYIKSKPAAKEQQPLGKQK